MKRHSDGFLVPTSCGDLFVTVAGDGPPLLLLHGFPQTHLMWRDLVPLLARSHTVVCADLPGYGQSACASEQPDHAQQSKRAMAKTLVEAMAALNFPRFCVAGHDRGARVAYRMALDHPDVVERLAIFDIVPTGEAWDRANADFALGYMPWLLLAQPSPLPETILTTCADKIVDAALGGWGTPRKKFPADVRESYIAALRDPAHAHAICEEYRAAAGIDRTHDRADRTAGHHIAAPTLVLWAKCGPLDTWYTDEGGPLAIWRAWATDVRGHAVDGGHFFPEADPKGTAEALLDFLKTGARR